MVRCRYGANGEYTERQSATPVGRMQQMYGSVPEQWGASRSMMPGKWDRGIYLFLPAEQSVSGPARSSGGILVEVPVMVMERYQPSGIS